MRQPPSAELLLTWYVDEGKSIRAIASETGWSDTRVHDLLRAAGVPLRRRGAPAGPRRVTNAALFALAKRNLSGKEMAAELACSEHAVRLALRHYGITASRTRPPQKMLSEAFLRRRYVKQGKSARVIAEEVGCHLSTVYKALGDYGIPRQQPWRDPRGRGPRARGAM